MLPGLETKDSATHLATRSASCPEPARGNSHWLGSCRYDSRVGSLTGFAPEPRTPTGLTCSYLTSVTFGPSGRRLPKEHDHDNTRRMPYAWHCCRRCAPNALYPRPERRGFTTHLVMQHVDGIEATGFDQVAV